MDIVSVCIVGVITAVSSLLIKKYNPEISFLVAVAGCIVIFITVLVDIVSVKDTLTSILSVASINTEYIAILFKAVGICFITEFACDCCIDAGQRALANNVSFAGKILVLVTAMPLYNQVLKTVLSLTGGA